MTVLGIDVSKRFWDKVNVKSPTDCWEWLAGINSTGRGNFKFKGKDVKAHRMAYMLWYQEDIPDGMLVCHTCDNGKCVNPAHLYLGTYKDNARDAFARGRRIILYGDNDPKSKLTSNQVIEIVDLWKSTFYSQRELGEIFGVSRSTIEGIISGKIWKRTTHIMEAS